MKTLDELKYYCNEPEPVGALMLTGEWGCGKTYLIDHELVKELEDSHVIIRVSLFGIDSIDALNLLVKKKWASGCSGLLSTLQDNEKIVNGGKQLLRLFGNLVPAALKDIGNAAISIDFLDFITVSPKVTIGGIEKRLCWYSMIWKDQN